jgi:hypothetical protein
VRATALRWAGVIGAFALLTLALFWPLCAHVVGGGPARWLEGDVPEEYWPDLIALCRGVHHAHLPRWLPWEHAGTPFYADPQAGVYNPLNWAICAVAGAEPSLGWAEARVALHFFLAGVFMVLFLRGERLRFGPALVGGALFVLSPFVRHNWELNLTAGIAWLPLVLFALSAAVRRPSLLRGALAGLALAAAATVGSPPALFFVILVSVIFCITKFVGILTWPMLGMFAVAVLVFVGLTACALLPAAELASLSVQSGRALADIGDGGLAPTALATSEHTRVGGIALALAVWAFASPRPAPSRRLWLGVAIAALGMMCGLHTPLFRVAWWLVPGVSRFRDPTRYSALLGFAVAALAAAGVDAFLTTTPSRRARMLWAAVVAGAAIVVALAGGLAAAAALALAGGCLLVGRATPIALLVCVELWGQLPPERHTRAGPFVEGAAALPRTDGAWRVWDEFGVGFRAGTRHRVRELRGYQDPLSLGRYAKIVDDALTPALLAQLNVRWVLDGPHYLHGAGHHLLGGARPSLSELAEALPVAYWVERAERVADADAALARLRQVAPAPVAILEGGGEAGRVVERDGARWAPATARVADELVTVDVDAPASGWLVVNEAWYPGWRATVDGAPVELRRANSFVRALPVAAGRHRVELAFRPWQPRVLEPLALATLLAIAAVAARALVLRSRRG